MKQILLYILTAISTSAGGIYLMYLFFTGLNNGAHPLLLLGSILLLCIGIFCLMRAGKSDATIIKQIRTQTITSNADSFEKVLARNNALSDEWSKTTHQRTKLQTLEIASTPDSEIK